LDRKRQLLEDEKAAVAGEVVAANS
jgi:hypothetical protein